MSMDIEKAEGRKRWEVTCVVCDKLIGTSYSSVRFYSWEKEHLFNSEEHEQNKTLARLAD